MKVKGVKRGRTIKLLENINIPDGAEVIVEIETTSPLSEAERLRKLNELFWAWKNQPDLMEAFAEVDEQRHAYRGRGIDSINNQDNSLKLDDWLES